MSEHVPAAAPKYSPPTFASREEELKFLRASRQTRDEEDQARADARELEELRLEERLTAEQGKRGHDFEIVSTPWGVWGVRKPDTQGIASYNRKAEEFSKSAASDATGLIGVLRHYILPPDRANEFHAVAAERPGVVTGPGGVGMAFMRLVGAAGLDAKKA